MKKEINLNKIKLIFYPTLIFILGLYLINNIIQKSSLPFNYEFELSIITSKDDRFQLFYSDDIKKSYNENFSLYSNTLKGDKSEQIISFSIQHDKKIRKIRIDLGQNIQQDTLYINYISFFSKGNQYALLKLKDDIKCNENVCYENGYFRMIKKNQKYDPFIEIMNVDKLVDLSESDKFKYVLGYFFWFVFYIFLLQLNIRYTYENIISVVFISVFISILLLPTIIKKFDLEKNKSNYEKRVLSPKPELKFSNTFPKEYDDYYNDNFGFRSSLIRWSYNIKLN